MNRKTELEETEKRFSQFKRIVAGAYDELQTYRMTTKLSDDLNPPGHFSAPEIAGMRVKIWRATSHFIKSEQTPRTQRRKTMTG